MNLIGDMRQYLGQDLADVIAGIIERKQGVSQYYILVISKNDPMRQGVLRTTIQLHSRKPPALIGTMCFHINNVSGKSERLWVLPLDIPHIALFEQEGEVNNKIMKQAIRMPVAYG